MCRSRLVTKARPHVFVLKRIHFDAFRPFVHTHTLIVFIENASISKRSKCKWIETKTHTYLINVDGRNGRKRIKMKAMTSYELSGLQNNAGAYVCSMRIEFNLFYNAQLYSFRSFWCGQSKTHQNGSVEANRSIRFRWQWAFKNALVWTGSAYECSTSGAYACPCCLKLSGFCSPGHAS